MADPMNVIATSVNAIALQQRRVLVGIDGVDGSGKTRFAARLADSLGSSCSAVIHADDHLNAPAIRHARGRHSPEGFWLDTYDLGSLTRTIEDVVARSGKGSTVVVEGMFLHREELRSQWDFSVFLDVPFAVTAARMAVRDGTHPDPEHPSMNRYVGGQRLYFRTARPWQWADVVVDNSVDVGAIIQPEDSSAARLYSGGTAED